MGGSGGVFGTSKQKASGAYKMTNDARLGEQEALSRLRNVGAGNAPSIGQMQMNANMDMANRQALALAASSRGASNPMLAFRQAQLANQQNGLEAAQQAAIMGQQERMQANQMLLAGAAGQRGVSLQSGIANQQNDAAKSARDAKYAYDATAGAGQTMMQMMSDERVKKNINPINGAADKVEAFADSVTPPPTYQVADTGPDRSKGGGGGGAGKAILAMFSDERAKKSIKHKGNSGNEIEEFVNNIQPYEYQYKNPAHGTGQKMGIMAQDLEKSDVGRTLVDQAPDGTKMVDTNKAIGAILAAVADINKKVKKLEK